MKKFMSLLFIALLALCLVACGDKPAEGNGDNGGNEGDGGGGATSEVKRDVKVEDAKLSNILGTGSLYVTTFGQADWAYMQTIVGDSLGYDLKNNDKDERPKLTLKESTGEYQENISKTDEPEMVTVFTANNQLQAADVKEGDVVIAVVGYTTKGISAEITQTGEVSRAKAISEKAGVKLILVQLSGKDRRGESSDPIIEACVKGADYVLIYDDGKDKGANFDGKYTEWCKGNENFFMFSDEYDICDYIKALVGKAE